MSSARVLHVITQFELGGAQLATLKLLRRLNRSQHHVALVAAPGGPVEADAQTLPDVEVRTPPSLTRLIHPWRDVSADRELTQFIRHHRFDIVRTHSSKAGIIGR